MNMRASGSAWAKSIANSHVMEWMVEGCRESKMMTLNPLNDELKIVPA
jgi:hypothetical protein